MTYHTGYFQTRFAYLNVALRNNNSFFSFLFFSKGGGGGWGEPQPVSVLDTLAKCEPT